MRPVWSAAYWAVTELPARLEAALHAPATVSVPGSTTPLLGPSSDCAAVFAANASAATASMGAFTRDVTAEADNRSCCSLVSSHSGLSIIRTDL